MNEIAGRWVTPVVVALNLVRERTRQTSPQREREGGGGSEKRNRPGVSRLRYASEILKRHEGFIIPTCRTLTYDRQSVPRLTRRQWSADTSKTAWDKKKISIPFRPFRSLFLNAKTEEEELCAWPQARNRNGKICKRNWFTIESHSITQYQRNVE